MAYMADCEHRRGTVVLLARVVSYSWHLYFLLVQRTLRLVYMAERIGLVVGKFAPLHIGHHELLDFAEAQCDKLHIISYSNPEFWHCEPERRYKWLRTYYPRARVTVVSKHDVFDTEQRNFSELPIMPLNTAPDGELQEYFAALVKALNANPAVLIGSEMYVIPTAQRLGCAGIRFRRGHRISATQIREGFIPPYVVCKPSVAADQVCRVAILGAESTGKSTLAQALAAKYRTEYVAEYGREYYEKHNGVSHVDKLTQIGITQLRLEHAAAFNARNYLFCDTSVLTTKMYAQLVFKHVPAELAALSHDYYDVMILCSPDFPLVQDRTRMNEEMRMKMHRLYMQEFLRFEGIRFQASGSVEERVKQFYDNVVCFRPPLRSSQHHSSL